MISMRAKSPPRAEALFLAMRPKPVYRNGVLIGNWVEEGIECPKGGTLYFPPKKEIDYEKMKPEIRQSDFRFNKLGSTQGTVYLVTKQDGHDRCGNYTTTNDLVYNHLPKPLCGPQLRRYDKAVHDYLPQPDLTKCYGNLTEWGLRNYKKYEWACTDVSDYASSLYEDTYVPPRPNQYLPSNERKARTSSFTKSFRFKMTKPITRKTTKPKK